ncbi:alkaline shock response membrane anchor protein AmaP [Streptococcus sp. X16XC17]|uniref:alkaline shock response membrane anchor protein AmaP n=1 Tax=unclassified Streptococcus TaxID=2608887 RepID=UPI00066FE767|nr:MULTISPECIES: alkaline shock response membrane anchor protein AmaP [unclassified Streptococcus]TCD45934.1 alkaline shock response membrane anchor protein AmaP [Streptococcus sp. X16XC17]
MSKFSKTLYSILGILLVILLGLTALEFAPEASLPNEVACQLPEFSRYGFWGEPLSNYIFWGALIFAVIALLVVIAVIFYPRTYTEVELADGKTGTLLLKKSAIEGYVKTIVRESGYMKSPSVKATLYRKKFKVKVAGKVVPRVAVLEKTSQLSLDIQNGLNEFFGVSKQVDFTVDVKHIEEKKKATSGRVE